jgi:hypothetical protein
MNCSIIMVKVIHSSLQQSFSDRNLLLPPHGLKFADYALKHKYSRHNEYTGALKRVSEVLTLRSYEVPISHKLRSYAVCKR